MTNPDINWQGQSGRTYGYWIHPLGTDFKDEPGNYIYAKQTEPNRWRAVYIGQTTSLRDRLADHEKEACARRNGATHIHAHTSSASEDARKLEETDLIAKHQPACNSVGVSAGGAGVSARWIPQPGDVVSASRSLYAHVGIVSDGTAGGRPTVISSSKVLGRGVVETWEQFAGGSPVRHAGYPGGLPRHVVVARAKAQLGRRWALFDNCEHFVTRAHGLRPHSRQLVALGLLAAAIWAARRSS